MTTSPPLVGVDFSSRPTRAKPVVAAHGCLVDERDGAALLRLDHIERFDTLDAFGDWLRVPEAWLGGFDFPFGLPRELVLQLRWPTQWLPLMRHYASLSRAQIREAFVDFCAARPVGAKFAHRACDRPAGSSPSMKWVNPPVAFMLHAGLPLLLDAGVHLPGLHAGDERRVALEAYPGLLARELIGRRSYKSDERARQTDERRFAREDIVQSLEQGRTRLKLRVALSDAQREGLLADGSGDTLDALLCLVQAAWASLQPAHGLPADIDPLEGWIVSA
jgi:hypothetical protein